VVTLWCVCGAFDNKDVLFCRCFCGVFWSVLCAWLVVSKEIFKVFWEKFIQITSIYATLLQKCKFSFCVFSFSYLETKLQIFIFTFLFNNTNLQNCVLRFIILFCKSQFCVWFLLFLRFCNYFCIKIFELF